jgi:hypothetical protein
LAVDIFCCGLLPDILKVFYDERLSGVKTKVPFKNFSIWMTIHDDCYPDERGQTARIGQVRSG